MDRFKIIVFILCPLLGFGQNQFKWVQQTTYTASGTNTYTATIPGLQAYTTDLDVDIRFTNSNSGVSTININSIGAVAIQKNGAALSSGDIPANSIQKLSYDGTNFQMVGQGAGGGGGGGSGWSLSSGGTLTGANTITLNSNTLNFVGSASRLKFFSEGNLWLGDPTVYSTMNATYLQIGNNPVAAYPANDAAVILSQNRGPGSPTGHGYVDLTAMYNSGGTAYNSFDARADFGGYAYDHYAAFQSRPTIGSTISNIYGLYAVASMNTGSVATNVYTAYAADAVGLGSVTNQYGLYTEPLTKGTNNFGVYTDGTTPSYFGGNVTTGGVYLNQNGANATSTATAINSYGLTFKNSTWNGSAAQSGWYSWRNEGGTTQNSDQTLNLYSNFGASPTYTARVFSLNAYDQTSGAGIYRIGQSAVNNSFRVNISSGDSYLGFQNSGDSFQGGFKHTGSSGVLTIDNTAGGGVTIPSTSVTIGGTTITNASTLFDLQSTSKALILPRVTNTAAVTTPVNGMKIYDVALNKERTYENGAWVNTIASRSIINSQVVATDANITAAAGVSYFVPASTFTNNRTIDVSGLNTDLDVMEVYVLTQSFTLSFTGATVYLADNVNTVTTIAMNSHFTIRRKNGRLYII